MLLDGDDSYHSVPFPIATRAVVISSPPSGENTGVALGFKQVPTSWRLALSPEDSSRWRSLEENNLRSAQARVPSLSLRVTAARALCRSGSAGVRHAEPGVTERLRRPRDAGRCSTFGVGRGVGGGPCVTNERRTCDDQPMKKCVGLRTRATWWSDYEVCPVTWLTQVGGPDARLKTSQCLFVGSSDSLVHFLASSRGGVIASFMKLAQLGRAAQSHKACSAGAWERVHQIFVLEREISGSNAAAVRRKP